MSFTKQYLALGLWKALRQTFGQPIHGCLFHWTQAVWRKVQAVGLTRVFRHCERSKKMIKRLMALPMLPEEHISAAFSRLKDKAPENLSELVEYIELTWVNSRNWAPPTWCQYMRPIRTNNNVEGWHRRFNHRTFANGPPSLYKLVAELNRESRLVHINAKLVSTKKLKKKLKKSSYATQSKLFKYWNMYEEGQCTTSKLLKLCSHLTHI